ncbi:DUF3380 domain-containing protein [Fulvimarina endophytica]|uniref:DUF3380 domain-containing protein n=1 Tax=Fulvimarina endophytica TaxID=2293836 RepID=A0A371WYN7_9HYPH|nr:N-acetylmuramidase domain-containing protein [Fulvimarina endophytica]RFC62093.1 DUF3380 domain-containing protein [Fulvimarina endophytica]
MAVDRQVIEGARRVGAESGVRPAILLAVAMVETRATPFVEIEGAALPLIRFEGHYFDRHLSEARRETARGAGLAHPRAGRIRNPATQSARWALFERAADIDREAACASVSWGLCQVMGAHAGLLGYGTAEALAREARLSIEGQFTLAARFLSRGNLAARLADGDVAGFSRRYNGPAYRSNRYDEKISAALARAEILLAEAQDGDWLARGARGAGVMRLQIALRGRGAVIETDGIFGPRTEAALSLWQGAKGLPVTGAADAATRRGLSI